MDKLRRIAATKIQSLFRGAMARAKFKQMRLRTVTRQFDLLEEREVVFTRKKRVVAREEFKLKIEAIKRDLLRNSSSKGSNELLPDMLPPGAPTLSRGHSDFHARQMQREWNKAEEQAGASKTKAAVQPIAETKKGGGGGGALKEANQAPVAAAAPSPAPTTEKKEKMGPTLMLPKMAPSLVKTDSTPGRNLKSDRPLDRDFVLAMIDRFKKGEKLDMKTGHRIIDEAKDLLKNESNVVKINIKKGSRCIVVGDLHGQLDDLVHLLTLNGLPSSRNLYVFNGDFVDRGAHSCEVVFILMAFKILFPQAVILNRGNHEATDINEEMGFCAECTRKYNRDMWVRFSDAFRYLPLCVTINDEIFVVHGGLCWEDVTLEQINKIKRDHLHPPYESNMEDLLWSDPMDVDEETGIEFKGRGKNDQRNDAGCLFGCDVVDRFFNDNGRLNLIVRSHECVDAGYEWFFESKLVTIFSASRYRGKDDNLGAVMLVTHGEDTSVKGVGNGGVTKHRGLRYRFIPYEAKKKERAKEFSLRLASLENQVLTLMVRHISHRRLALIHHFDGVSKGTGHITRRQWKQGLNKIIGVDVPFLSFQDALGLPMYGVDGTFRGPIDYMSFLSRFAPLYRHLRAEADVEEGEGAGAGAEEDGGGAGMAKKSAEEKEEESKVKRANDLLGQLVKVADRSGIRNVETLFRYFDYDGDGALSLEEFKVGVLSLTKVYPDLKFTSKEVDAVAETLGDKNGQISYREFFQNITVADNAYGRLLSLDNKAESLRADLDRLPNLELRKKLSDELDATERKRDRMNVQRMVRRHSLGLMAAPALVKAKSVPVHFDRKMLRNLEPLSP